MDKLYGDRQIGRERRSGRSGLEPDTSDSIEADRIDALRRSSRGPRSFTMNMTIRPLFTRTEPENLAILLWRDLWVAEIELREQVDPAWRAIDQSLLEARARLLEVMNPRDRGECEAAIGSFRQVAR